MPSNEDAGRIHKTSFKVTAITLFTLALFCVIGRTVIRYRYQKRLFLDDACLYFGIICLCAAMGLLLQSFESMYLNEAIITHSLTTEIRPNYQSLLFQYHKYSAAYLTLIYTTIFAVKFSFLFFLRVFVRRLRNMMIYWWTVFAIMILAWPISFVAGAFLPCPYFGMRSTICKRAPFGLPMADGMGALATILDITTDILLLIIPFHVLWHVQIDLRRKLILGITLCLSVFMIVIALIRVTTYHIESAPTNTRSVQGVDFVWVLFWLQVEACIAVIVVTLSAFRSIFVAHESRLREDQNRNRRWYMSKKNLMVSSWQRRKLGLESEEMDQLSKVPCAKMTGMSTFISGGNSLSENYMSSPGAKVTSMLVNAESAERIRVEQTISTNVDQMSQSSTRASALCNTTQRRDVRGFA